MVTAASKLTTSTYPWAHSEYSYRPQLPPKVDLNEDFAEYHSAYSFKGDVLQTERGLNVTLREVALNEYGAYKKFAEAVNADHEVYVGLRQRHVTPAPYQDAIWALRLTVNKTDAGSII